VAMPYKTQNERLLQINEAIQKNIRGLNSLALWRTENKHKSELRAALYYPIASDLIKIQSKSSGYMNCYGEQNKVRYYLYRDSKKKRSLNYQEKKFYLKNVS
jgi:hypothetical protein